MEQIESTSQFFSQEDEILRPLLWWLLNSDGYDLDKLRFTFEDISIGDNQKLFKAITSAYKDGFYDLIEIVKRWKELWLTQDFILSLNSEYSLQPISIPSYEAKFVEFIARKKLLRIWEELSIKVLTNKINNEDVMNYASKLLNVIPSSWINNYSVQNSAVDLYEYLEARKWKELFWFSFWREFEFLDKATRWIQQGRTYRIWAPSNMGKTQLVYGIINNIISQGWKVAFFSLENDRDMTLSNICANRQWINSWDLESWNVELSSTTLQELDWKLFIIDDTHELSEIFSSCLSIKPDVVILDYIWLVSIGKTSESDLFTEYAKKVQQFVKKNRLAWIDLSNLPIGVEDSEIINRWQFFGSSYLRNNADVGIHMVKYEDFYKAKELQESYPEFHSKLETDFDFRMKWINKKAISLAITKNRIWPAWLKEDFFVNFAKWWRFVQVTPQEKLEFEPIK